jgi:hypothetical protein
MNLIRIEMRRALRRRAVRVLIGLGALGCAFAGVVAFVGSRGKTVLEMRLDEGSPAIMTDWWISGANEGYLVFAMVLLALGALFGGATVAGGEWRAGTVTTMLTWEPRRLRFHGARNASAAILAFTISFALQAIFLAAFLPAVFAHGTTDGVDVSFWVALGGAIARTSLVTAVAALLGIALATAARNTAFAVMVVFGWMAVLENLVRGLRPSWAPWLWGENVGTVMTWQQIPDVEFTRGPALALATLAVYCGTIIAGATVLFARRDVTATA